MYFMFCSFVEMWKESFGELKKSEWKRKRQTEQPRSHVASPNNSTWYGVMKMLLDLLFNKIYSLKKISFSPIQRLTLMHTGLPGHPPTPSFLPLQPPSFSCLFTQRHLVTICPSVQTSPYPQTSPTHPWCGSTAMARGSLSSVAISTFLFLPSPVATEMLLLPESVQ